ncbi:CHAT domain-containing protein [Erythrobacter oryzae]|uniref:CHAT domain-containing protein n=1 Tax=Erythrobacter oryzae TaxID=3019556 RepID=UPI002554FAAC|nr:CHAT domain-containing tetratricopeptide repeat protein [Erythrobacter sp. COR-2]
MAASIFCCPAAVLAACFAVLQPIPALAASGASDKVAKKTSARAEDGKLGKGGASTSYRPLVERLEAAISRGDTARVATLLPVVDALVLNSQDAAPEDQDQALPVLQSAHALLGDFAGERGIIERRAALAASREGPKSYAAAILAVDVADLLRREGRPAEGEAHLRRVVAASKDPEVRIGLQRALASYLDDAQHLGDAIDAYRALLAMQVEHKGPDSDDAFRTVEALSWDLGQTGRHAEALALLATTLPRAEAVWRATGADETKNGTMESLVAGLRYANLLERQADHLGAQGKISQSDLQFEAANRMRTRYFTRPTHIVAQTYNNMAFRQNFQGRFALAETNARKALEIFEGFFSGTDTSDSLTYAKYKYNLAAALLGQGRAEEALPLLRFGVPIQRKLDPDHADLVILLTTLSRAIVAAGGDRAEALALAREAAAIARRHRDARAAGGYADSAPDGASAALTRALAGDATTHDPLSMAYGALMEATAAGVKAGGPADAAALRSEMFIAAQDLEQSTAGQAMAQAAARAMAGDGPLGALITRKQQLADRARALNLAVTASILASEAAGLAEKRSALAQVTRELAETDAQLKRSFPEFEELVSPAALSLADVKARLAADEALVLIVPNGADTYVFAVAPDREEVVVLDKATEPVTRLVARLRCRMDEATCLSDADLDVTSDQTGALEGIDAFFPRFDRAAAHRLYTTIVQPIEPALGKAKRVFVTVAGPLGGLPLPVLVTDFDPAKDKADAGDAETLKQSAWLGDRYAFITLPAVSALRIVRPQAEAAAPRNGFLGYGAPALEGSAGAARSVEQGGRRLTRAALQPVATASPEALRKLSPLPGTEIELKSMAAALDAPIGGLRLGSDATEAALKQDDRLASAQIIAFATHGLLPKEVGRGGEPGLVFTPPATASALDDGLLTASEAARLSLAAEWLILSACNTAASDGTPGSQSLSGLARAFLHAGAKAMLVSHWRVSDEVTAVLTVETLRLSRTDLPKAEALRQAMIAVRTGQRADGSALPGWKEYWAHPAAWSPFVLVAADGS